MFLMYYIAVICLVLLICETSYNKEHLSVWEIIAYSLVCSFLDLIFIYQIAKLNGNGYILLIGSRCLVYIMLSLARIQSEDRIAVDLCFFFAVFLEYFVKPGFFPSDFLALLICAVTVKMIDVLQVKVFRYFIAYGISVTAIYALYIAIFHNWPWEGYFFALTSSLIISIYCRYKKSWIQIVNDKEKMSLLIETNKLTQDKYNLISNLYNGIAFFIYEPQKDIVWINRNFCRLFAYPEKYCLKGSTLIKDIRQNICLADNKSFLSPGKGEMNIMTKLLQHKWIRYKTQKENNKIIGAIVDITDERERILTYDKLLKIDQLTGFINRYEYKNRINAMIDHLSSDKTLAFYLLNIDGFRKINGRYGHSIGDEILKEFAKRLLSLGKDYLFIRIAGDEFGIVEISNKSFEDMSKFTWNAIKNLFSYSIVVEDIPFDLSCTCGAACYIKHASTCDRLLEYADFALSRAKDTKRGSMYVFDADEYEDMKQNIQKAKALDYIVKNKEFYHVFQPIINVRTSEIEGYEALMRVKGNQLFKNTQSFFDTALLHNRLFEAEKASIEKLFSDIKSKKIQHKSLFINYGTDLSVSKLKQLDIPTDIDIVYEITEYAKIDQKNIEQFREAIEFSKGKIAVDDFGAGYSNEISILAVHPDYIKIDMALIRNIDSDPRKQALVKNIIDYTHMLKVKTIAEGIETYNEMECTIRLGTDYLQGYYLGKPSKEFFNIPDNIKFEINNIKENNNKRERSVL